MRAAAPDALDALLDRRTEANRAFFAEHAERLARLCHRMAERFARGGRLVALGATPAARSDARHVAVEFVHPVIVGKRALPAIGLAAEGGDLPGQLALTARPDDIVIGFGVGEDGGETARALADATRARMPDDRVRAGRRRVGVRGRRPPIPRSARSWSRRSTTCCGSWCTSSSTTAACWRAATAGRPTAPAPPAFSTRSWPSRRTTSSASSTTSGDRCLMKADEVADLRRQTLTENRDALVAAAADLRQRFDRGGRLLAFGNGGSATDAMDVVADFRNPQGAARRWPAIDLTEDPAILTAIANDIGAEAMFSRQVIAHGQADDMLLAISTSGGSANVIQALAEARRRGLGTIALVGYDGGRVAAEGLADHVVISRSEHIPRIQEAQASAYHALRNLVDDPPAAR